jgi:hypothetical protein
MKAPIAAILGAALTAGMALAPNPAHAVCVQTLYAERAATNAVSTTLYGRVTSTSLVIWFGTTANDVMENLIASAVAQRNRVTVVGSAATCPAAPATGFRNMGTITSIILSP